MIKPDQIKNDWWPVAPVSLVSFGCKLSKHEGDCRHQERERERMEEEDKEEFGEMD
jgi:hypothetical protein